jgi:hypothetical protein
LRDEESENQYQAERQLIPMPSVSAEQLLNFNFQEREEDDPTVMGYWRAKTRDILPSVSLICLHITAQGLAFDAKGTRLLDLDDFKKPDRKIVKSLMGRVVNVTHPRVVDFFTDLANLPPALQQLKPESWKKHGTLRYTRVAVFTNGLFKLQGTDIALKLTDSLGLEVVPAS